MEDDRIEKLTDSLGQAGIKDLKDLLRLIQSKGKGAEVDLDEAAREFLRIGDPSAVHSSASTAGSESNSSARTSTLSTAPREVGLRRPQVEGNEGRHLQTVSENSHGFANEGRSSHQRAMSIPNSTSTTRTSKFRDAVRNRLPLSPEDDEQLAGLYLSGKSYGKVQEDAFPDRKVSALMHEIANMKESGIIRYETSSGERKLVKDERLMAMRVAGASFEAIRSAHLRTTDQGLQMHADGSVLGFECIVKVDDNVFEELRCHVCGCNAGFNQSRCSPCGFIKGETGFRAHFKRWHRDEEARIDKLRVQSWTKDEVLRLQKGLPTDRNVVHVLRGSIEYVPGMTRKTWEQLFLSADSDHDSGTRSSSVHAPQQHSTPQAEKEGAAIHESSPTRQSSQGAQDNGASHVNLSNSASPCSTEIPQTSVAAGHPLPNHARRKFEYNPWSPPEDRKTILSLAASRVFQPGDLSNSTPNFDLAAFCFRQYFGYERPAPAIQTAWENHVKGREEETHLGITDHLRTHDTSGEAAARFQDGSWVKDEKIRQWIVSLVVVRDPMGSPPPKRRRVEGPNNNAASAEDVQAKPARGTDSHQSRVAPSEQDEQSREMSAGNALEQNDAHASNGSTISNNSRSEISGDSASHTLAETSTKSPGQIHVDRSASDKSGTVGATFETPGEMDRGAAARGSDTEAGHR